MTDDNDDTFTLQIDVDENGLANCGCGSNKLHWRPPSNHNAREADHSLEEAREIGGRFPWDYHDPDDESMQRLFDDAANEIDSWEEYVAREKAKAERNGVVASCADCYGSMSPTVKTDELRDSVDER